MKLKQIFCFHLLFLICSCGQTKPHIEAAHRITTPFIKKACKNHALEVMGSGGGMMNQVENISIYFKAQGEYDINQARKHFLSVIIPFVEEIGNSDEIKPFLLYPNNPEKIPLVSICYLNPLGKDPIPPKIAHVIMYMGEISYSVCYSRKSPYAEVFTETYQEAIERANYAN